MSLMFLTTPFDAETKSLLKRAYDRAYEKLTAMPGVDGNDFTADDLAAELIELFQTGLRDEAKLTRDAVFNMMRNLTEGMASAAE